MAYVISGVGTGMGKKHFEIIDHVFRFEENKLKDLCSSSLPYCELIVEFGTLAGCFNIRVEFH